MPGVACAGITQQPALLLSYTKPSPPNHHRTCWFRRSLSYSTNTTRRSVGCAASALFTSPRAACSVGHSEDRGETLGKRTAYLSWGKIAWRHRWCPGKKLDQPDSEPAQPKPFPATGSPGGRCLQRLGGRGRPCRCKGAAASERSPAGAARARPAACASQARVSGSPCAVSGDRVGSAQGQPPRLAGQLGAQHNNAWHLTHAAAMSASTPRATHPR